MGVWGQQMQTSIYRMVNTKVLLYNIRSYIQYLVINHYGKEYIKKNVYICTTESFCCTAEINTTFQITYTSINKYTDATTTTKDNQASVRVSIKSKLCRIPQFHLAQGESKEQNIFSLPTLPKGSQISLNSVPHPYPTTLMLRQHMQ